MNKREIITSILSGMLFFRYAPSQIKSKWDELEKLSDAIIEKTPEPNKKVTKKSIK